MTTILYNSPLTFSNSASDSATRPLAAVASLLRAVRLNELARQAIEAKPPAPVQEPLLTDRLVIRALTSADRREFERVMRSSKSHLARFCPLSKRDERVFDDGALFSRHLELCQAGDRKGLAWRRMIFDRSGKLLGAININDISRGFENEGELVFWLAQEAVGQGVASEAIKHVMRMAFADAPEGLGLHKLVALVAPENMACRKALRRAGFDPGLGAEQVQLLINGEHVTHDQWVAYAPVAPASIQPLTGDARPLLRGLNSMMRLEAGAATHNHTRAYSL